MMNPTPLNYSTHALENLARLIKEAPQTDPLLQPFENHNIRMLLAWFELLSKMLNKAVKFTIPDNGKLMDGDGITETKVGLLRLPFPIVALEYSAPNLNDNVDAHHLASEKRIALAFDLSRLDPADLAQIGSVLNGLNKIDIHERIGVISIYHTDLSGWEAALGMSVFDREEELVEAKNKYTGKIMKGMPTDVLSVSFKFKTPQEAEEVNRSVDTDSTDEVIAVVDFCAIMNCNNVGTQIIPASDKLNKKRVASGKLPLFDYHVLMLNPAASAQNASKSVGGTHASPRMHLRRGHIRRLQEGRVTWVNAAVIGNRNQGVVEKSYKIKI